MNYRLRPLALVFSALMAGANSAPGAGLDPAHFAIELTDLGAGVNPTAINNVGQVAGQFEGVAFRWQSGVMTELGTLGGSQSFANDLNDAGVVVGWSHDSTGKRKSFKWDGAMTNLDSTVVFEGAAEAINSHGTIVGWRTTGSAWKTVRWGQFNNVGQFLFQNENHKAVGINDEGEIVALALKDNGDPEGGYYWNGIDSPGEFTTGIGQDYFPTAGINENGVTAGVEGNEASYLTVNIGQLESAGLNNQFPHQVSFSTVLGLNDLDFLVGEFDSEGFIYDMTNNQLFAMSAYASQGFQADSIVRVTDISDNNQFSGVALVDGGIEHGVVGRFVPLLPGDYDLDGEVDGGDLLAWQRQLGASAEFPYAGADGDGSGAIDASDLAVWRDHFGAGATAASVPEPAVSLLVMIAAAGICGFHGRTRQAPARL